MLVQRNQFGPKKKIESKILYQKNCVQKNFRSKKILVQRNFVVSEKKFGPKICRFQMNVEFENNYDSKTNFGSKANFGSEINFEYKKTLCHCQSTNCNADACAKKSCQEPILLWHSEGFCITYTFCLFFIFSMLKY